MSLLDIAPVVPVVVIDDLETAVPLARALVAGGLPVIEVTLRTVPALKAVKRIAAEVPEAVIGTGTVRTRNDVLASVEAGAKFLVSPGSTPALVDAMEASGLPFLPGVATASEVMTLAERGLTEMKFFPAEAAGGLPYLKSLGGPLPDVRFCPTGGIKLATAPDYLALPNVGCVGGTWLTPADALATGDYARIEKLAAEAAALRPGA
ncbi:bifunctional 4-hydroxy-2-oxoglutarate aldolase/2-dehydro-3-deoxy-phosphogluconate aldolase [Planomonospora sp. ID67723]|uniref:bifunctional 4-hydroxy-2-oxoglutarate aldolase/2-dehydro-3-deoxy-phosphogluconate aldolase n=1 Tax=Planomonospora sp. ID67723 TaxID=2738134 RepID=UPI0018C40025|nr:bifunctional 4-hydroxy-2-oxoglutarate aldolase/2-dehydro-3-deoxy-phosphogluconate aldolase [Planomonospora sp. ID67723]MBG0829944.1 bifunctional 4-hydroxy-2-oxoglutarate aldolase/2-dehydro-3-deoxy-phosphogluconate aldolase [Planomonospora sp. ID67723]